MFLPAWVLLCPSPFFSSLVRAGSGRTREAAVCLPAEQVAGKNAAGAMPVKGAPERRSSSNSLLGSMNTQFYKGSTERPGRFTAVQVTAGPPRLPFLMVALVEVLYSEDELVIVDGGAEEGVVDGDEAVLADLQCADCSVELLQAEYPQPRCAPNSKSSCALSFGVNADEALLLLGLSDTGDGDLALLPGRRCCFSSFLFDTVSLTLRICICLTTGCCLVLLVLG